MSDRIWLLTGVLVLGACEVAKTTAPEDPALAKPVVTTVVLSESSLAVDVGKSATLSAEFLDQFGNPSVLDPTDTQITWRSSDPSVARVNQIAGDLAGITGVAPGTATVTVSRFQVSASATVTVTQDTRVRLAVTNVLLGPIDIQVNGGAPTRIEPGDTARMEWDVLASLDLEWDLVRPTTSGGRAVGESIGGAFSTITDPAGDYVRVVDNVVGSTTYFAPVVSNETTVPLLMGVNMGLAEEQRCECLIPASTPSVYLGYYTLLTGSNVRGYSSGSGYQGSYIYWEDFASSLAALSGQLGLRATTAPSPVSVSTPASPGVTPLPNPVGLRSSAERFPDHLRNAITRR